MGTYKEKWDEEESAPNGQRDSSVVVYRTSMSMVLGSIPCTAE